MSLRPLVLLAVCAALAVLPLPARAGGEVELERLTWIDVRDAIARGVTTALIPTGGTEQNGAHMALGKHNFIVAETSRRIARALGDALMAPVIAYVPEGDAVQRSGHMAYAGTISVPDEVFSALLEAAAASLKAHGFKLIVFLGDSGGNQRPQQELARRLTARWAGDGVRVINAAAYYAAGEAEAMLLSEGETAASIGTHAGIRDTSELMAVMPSAVDLAKARPDADGARGDARRASAARGERLIALKVAAAVAEIRAARQAPGAPPPDGLLGWLRR